ncbi:hypothetical protein NliqN6_6469 [Naganishia liquefaciens]|uniref:Uncharacterized protein n=1 Tax=Naganishia liquefaciens TaxID=104408 RepID=A0A8H3TZL9_9TREE|nr:hypothetical protein NliqN6_6469 [Naganishia liquefaciens]
MLFVAFTHARAHVKRKGQPDKELQDLRERMKALSDMLKATQAGNAGDGTSDGGSKSQDDDSDVGSTASVSNCSLRTSLPEENPSSVTDASRRAGESESA